MKIDIRNRRDFCAGLLFVFFGVVAVVVATDYPTGNALRMGPGYFPTLLGSTLFFLGLLIQVRSLFFHAEAMKPWIPRPILVVLGAVLSFAFLIESAGLVLATLAVVIVSSLAGEEFRLRELVLLSLMLVALAVGLFAYGLGLPFKIWRGW